MAHNRSNPDFSTINLSRLRALSIYNLPPTYTLGDPGNGCAGDPPGYPTYFTRAVYNATGNTPRNAPQYVIKDGNTLRVVVSKDAPYDRWTEQMRRLWKPLGLDHPRTVAWMKSTYAHHTHCYADVDGLVKKPEYGRPGTVVWPDDRNWQGLFKVFHDDPRFSEEWRQLEMAQIAEANRQMALLIEKVARPENHNAVRVIQRYYPNHQPYIMWIQNPPEHPGNWWETAAEQPTPEDCPGQYSMTHPCNGSWCQWCGWREKEENIE